MRNFKFVAILCVILFSNILKANELTTEQKKFQNSLFTFLTEEGFSPTINESNILNFKINDKLYWITINECYPFYIEFHRDGFKCHDINLLSVIYACNQSNLLSKCVKSTLKSDTVSLAIEMFCHSSEEFKYIFYKSIKELDKAYNTIDEYNKEFKDANNLDLYILKVELANFDSNGTVLTDYGTIINSENTKYIKPRITVYVKTNGMYDIYIKFITSSGLSTSSNSPEGFSYKNSIDMQSGTHTYSLSGWGNDVLGHWKKGNYKLEFYYDGKIIGEKKFVIY